MSHLLPDGIGSLRDVPYRLLDAIKAGLMFLSFEELPSEDVPPRSIWTDGPALKAHFDRVRRRQKEAMGDKGEIEDPRENAALDLLIVGDR